MDEPNAHVIHIGYRILGFVAMKIEVSWRNARFRNSRFRKRKPFAGYPTHDS